MITDKKSPYRIVSEAQLRRLRSREDTLFARRTKASKEAFDKAQAMLLNGVPMPWMGDWGTSHPIFVSKAYGNRVIDVDGNEYIDFCLGDTGPCSAIPRRPPRKWYPNRFGRVSPPCCPQRGAWPSAGSWRRRFGLPYWQVAMTATEANRYVIRICRALTGRPKVLVFQRKLPRQPG